MKNYIVKCIIFSRIPSLNDDHSITSIELIGQNVSSSFSSDKVDAINDLFSRSDLPPPIASNVVRVHLKTKVNGHIYSLIDNKRAPKQNDVTILFPLKAHHFLLIMA